MHITPTILPVKTPECKILANAKDAKGFVRIRVAGKTAYQHRYVYAKSHGLKLADIKDLIITPSCGRYDCVNPDHLIASSKSTLEYKFINNG